MAEEQACLDLADLILETAQQVDRFAQASLAPGALHTVQSLPTSCDQLFPHVFATMCTVTAQSPS